MIQASNRLPTLGLIAFTFLANTYATEASAQVIDDFDRPNAPLVGNGWIQKNPGAFSIAGNQVSKDATSWGYLNNIAYRPAAEDLLDVEASVELSINAGSPGYPQVLTRVQAATVQLTDTLDGYILYLPDSNSTAVLGRQTGSSFVTTLAAFSISPALNTTDVFRLRLSSTGTNPVQLNAFVERQDGANWTIIGQASFADSSGSRIAAAGSVGFGGYIETSYDYDNFRRQDLGGASNPTPVLNSIAPMAATEGGSAFTLTLTGSDFIPGSTVRWNGADRGTTFISAAELQVAITAADIAVAGSATVTVFTPAPGGGTSAGQTFTIDAAPPTNPAPVLNSIAPTAAIEGGSAFTLTLTGVDFIAGSTVRWNGADRGTTFVSGTQLQAAITAADVATAGTATVTVFTPAPGGGTSASQTFTIDVSPPTNPAPVLASIAPSAAVEGGSAFSLTLTGSDFIPGSIVRWNGADRGTTFISGAQLQAAISAADVAAAGSVTVSVFNPAPGGGTSAGQTFTIDAAPPTNPVPVLANIAPNSTTEGGSAFTLTVTGSDFIAGSVVRWNGANRTTNFISAAQLQADITAADVAAAGIATVTVFNPAPGGGTSAGQAFTIDAAPPTNPTPVLTVIAPNSAIEGGSAFALTVTGSDFIAGSVVRWNGANRATTFVSAGELQAEVSVADIATPGVATVTVFNPAPGGGTSGGQTFTIDALPPSNPAPQLATIAPNTTTEGGSSFSLNVTGTDFIAGSVVQWNGAARGTTFVSNTQLQAAITAADISVAGTATITVVNPAPGGGTSTGQAFTIDSIGPNNPVPFVDTLGTENAVVGSGETTVAIIGNGFVAASVARWNGADRPTTFVSSQQLDITLSAGDLSALGTGAITVFNPPPAGGATAPQPFFVLDAGQAYFFDSFNSADSPTIGNNWTEKYPDAFSIVDNEVAGIVTWGNIVYRDSIVYRPAGEDRQDVEVGMEFVRRPGSQFAQVHARVQRDVVALPQFLESYILYMEDNELPNGALAIAVQPGIDSSGECLMEVFPLPAALQDGNRYRLRFEVTGTNPVRLVGSFDEFDGTQWQQVMSETVLHDANTQRDPSLYCDPGFMPAPITGAGTVGFSKWWTLPDIYDNFYWRDLSGQPQIPSIESLNPTFAEEGSAQFPLTVSGDNFVAGSVVRWNGSDRPTSFIGNNTVQADITAADVANVGGAEIRVVNPGDVLSNPLNFSIVPVGGGLNPVPVIGAVTPDVIQVGSGDQSIAVSGSDFVPGSSVSWNGQALLTTFVSSTSLSVQVPAALVATAGEAVIAITNPAPGGGASAFAVANVVSPQTFVDNFARADSNSLGNGWIEKNQAAFVLNNGAVLKQSVGAGYLENPAYRPASEDILDAEVSVELRLLNPGTPGYPQLFTRLQSATAGAPSVIDGYMLYLNDTLGQAVLGRQINSNFVTTLAVMDFSESLDMNNTYRMRMSAVGTSPVTLQAYVERLTPTGWLVIGQSTFVDNSGARIATPGSAGIGGYIETGYTYDNFIRRPLP